MVMLDRRLFVVMLVVRPVTILQTTEDCFSQILYFYVTRYDI